MVVTMLFCLPQAWPSTIDTFNYAPLALGAVPALADALWAAEGRRTCGVPERRPCRDRNLIEPVERQLLQT
ncbi:hypothetical protein ACFXKY_15840 [Streptomyces canus]|uniref:hypothetical protein n=1 Tax=Streptomyces canus TaxID=58343 RepID=UPI0036941F9F